MERSIRYEGWMQRLLRTSQEVGVSEHVLEEFIRIWDERTVNLSGRDVLEVEHAG